jgi:hypothetical protein
LIGDGAARQLKLAAGADRLKPVSVLIKLVCDSA